MKTRQPLFLAVLILAGMCAFLFVACSGSSGGGGDNASVALIYVGHGEPEAFEDGDVRITHSDGSDFGPHAEDLGVTGDARYTEWAAAYEEIATAMTYIFYNEGWEGDFNQNEIRHEVAMAPTGDVPFFFTWENFHAEAASIYGAFSNYSPHNDSISDHVSALDVNVGGADVDIYTAFLDAVPRIPDVVYEITESGLYEKVVVVPMLLSSSTHTQEVENFMEETAHMTSGLDVVVSEPFFDVPYMRDQIKEAVVAMAQEMRLGLPPAALDEDIGVVLASHGTPYLPPFEEFGYVEGDIYSNLLLTEDIFHEEIAEELTWDVLTGRMNYAEPSIGDAITAFEDAGKDYIIVVPSAFPTAAMHTMWDVVKGIHKVPSGGSYEGDAVLPSEGVVSIAGSGATIYYTSAGYADSEPGASYFQAGLAFIGRTGIMEVLE